MSFFTQSHHKNAKIVTIIDNQQPKRNDSNKTMHKQTYLEGERKCIKPMNGKKDEKPLRRRRSLLRE